MSSSKKEDSTGINFNWNSLPLSTKKLEVPFGCLYNYKDIGNDDSSVVPLIKYNPCGCKFCNCVFNPYSKIDYNNKTWMCPICYNVNNLPSGYSGISPQNRPAECFFNNVEYLLKKSTNSPPIYFFLIDQCLDNEELSNLKESLKLLLDLIPENSIIGLIVFGTVVQFYELNFTECSKAYIFSGENTTKSKEIAEQLGIYTSTSTLISPLNSNILNNNSQLSSTQNPQKSSFNISDQIKRFFLPISECEIMLTTIIEDLTIDSWPILQNCRARRCTGTALAVATNLLELFFNGIGARILLFVGGACTIGEGAIVGLNHNELIRLHNDIKNETAKNFKKAKKFYDEEILKKLAKNGHALDLFVGSLDQIGILEMKSCVENTGGFVALADSFGSEVFKESIKNYFQVDKNGFLKIGLNGVIEVLTSNEVKINGAIGPVISIQNDKEKMGKNFADFEIGNGKTNMWKINSIFPSTTVGFFMEFDDQKNLQSNKNYKFIQILTSYQHPDGSNRLRVCIKPFKVVNSIEINQEIVQSFDQECAAVLVARLAIFKAEKQYIVDVLNWIDKMLIKFVFKCGSFTPGIENSLQLSPNIVMFPQFIFHLRRSRFLKVFNSSPDETSFIRITLNRENIANSLIMIQPTLRSYSFSDAPHAVMLDTKSVKKDNILLLDSYFDILIHYGETICKWRDLGYQNDSKYVAFKQLLSLPSQDAKKLISGRYPYPRYTECDESSSQARILYSKINPSSTHHNTQVNNENEFKVLTDDVSYETFVQHLKKLVVNLEQN